MSLAGLFLLGASDALQTAIAEGDTRTISFHHVHTGEDITITYKRDGRYDDAALKKLNWFMRDWRKDEQTRMDPHLFDILWETYREVGGTQPIQVIGGYRSAATNSMLRARSSGVAKTSQHTAGNAMDFYIPGVPLAKVREVGLRLQRGGVGFYPTSGSPFIHMDTGSVRHWPRMTYAELSRVFPDGRTVHVAADGRPLPGYALALAEVERHGKAPNGVSLQAARSAGVITASQEQEAEGVGAKPKNLFASLFGVGKQKDAEETADEAVATPAPKRGRAAATAVASVAAPKPIATENIVPLPSARPQVAPVAVASAEPNPAAYPFTAALAPAGNVFESRGYWHASVDGEPAPSPAKSAPFEVASADMTTTGSTPPPAAPLAYAATDAESIPSARARPMGKAGPQATREASATPARTSTTLAAKTAAVEMSFGGQSFDSPWLRAAMLTPSVHGVMTATRFGIFDPRPLQHLLHHPADALTMTFSAEPTPGMMADRFSGSAVVFLATTTFVSSKTAALR